MKKLALTFLAMAAALQVWAADGEWLTDLGAAQAKAAKEKKLVFVEFTGSDWCPPCKSLKKNVLSSAEFLDYAKKNLVLVELDFPQSKPQPKALKEANAKLAEKFGVNSYPTVILLDGTGKELDRQVGYGGTGVKDYIAKLEKFKKS